MTHPVAGCALAEDVSAIGVALRLGSLGPFRHRVFRLGGMV